MSTTVLVNKFRLVFRVYFLGIDRMKSITVLLFIFTSFSMAEDSMQFNTRLVDSCKRIEGKEVKEFFDKKKGKHFIIVPANCTYSTYAKIYKKNIEIVLETNLYCSEKNYKKNELKDCLEEKIYTRDAKKDSGNSGSKDTRNGKAKTK